MEVISLTCNHCGAPLDAGAQAKFLTCSYCNSRLKIVRSSSSAWTEVLDDIRESQNRIEAATDDIAEDLEVIKAQNDLELFDREWGQERQRYLVRDKDGNVREPSAGNSALGLLFIIPVIIFCLIFMGFINRAGAPPIFMFAPVIVMVLIVAGALSSMSRSKAYSQRLRVKNRQRARLLQQLEDARRRSQ